MQEVFEKIAERLEVEIEHSKDNYKDEEWMYRKGIRFAIRIVNQVAEEYKECDLCYFSNPCEYQNKDARMPESELNNGWIPCNERLPEEDENRKYLVCGNKGGIYIAEFVCKTIDGKTSIGPWWSASGKYCPKPIAWRTLPEPYKGE